MRVCLYLLRTNSLQYNIMLNNCFNITNLLIRIFFQIEIELEPDNRFHSIFACPILRQQSSEDNPPMKLLCGHVISRDALNKLSNGPM